MGKRKPHPFGRPPKEIVDEEEEKQQGTVFFYLPTEKPYGIFCQWHTSPFSIPTASLQWLVDLAPPPLHALSEAPPTASTILSSHATSPSSSSSSNPSITFTCVEQSYMYLKALFFSDAPTSRLILAARDPKTQKKHGQRVKHFNFEHWTQVKSRVARVGNWYKYTGGDTGDGNGNEKGRGKGKGNGNAHMKSVLLGTRGRELVEAAGRDRIWGIGYRAHDAEFYREFWGENLLGRCLMYVRDRILEIQRREEGEGEVVDWQWDGALDGEEE